jgi:hypothetical protein
MKTQKTIHSHSIRRLLLMVPMICSTAFAACSEVAGTAGTHPAVNLQTAAVGEPQTGDNVTIGPLTYHSEAWDVPLLATIQPVHAEPTPRVDLPENDTLEVMDPKVILKGSTATISGSVQPSIPWAETDWGYLEVALYDNHGGLIKQVAVDYFPRPVPHPFHSAYQPRSHFYVTIKGATQSVRSVVISYHS